MALKLTERSRVKDILGIALADLVNDTTINGMIDQASREVEQICRRTFTKGPRREYYQSYEQNPFDPDPQYLWLDGPIDPDEGMTIVWAAYDRHDDNGITLTPPPALGNVQLTVNADYRVDLDKSLVIIRSSTGSVANMPIPAAT